MQFTLSESEKKIDATNMRYLAPPNCILKAPWRKEMLFYTDKRVFWIYSFRKKKLERPSGKIKVVLEKRRVEPTRKSEIVFALAFKLNGERDKTLFSIQFPLLKKGVQLVGNNKLPTLPQKGIGGI